SPSRPSPRASSPASTARITRLGRVIPRERVGRGNTSRNRATWNSSPCSTTSPPGTACNRGRWRSPGCAVRRTRPPRSPRCAARNNSPPSSIRSVSNSPPPSSPILLGRPRTRYGSSRAQAGEPAFQGRLTQGELPRRREYQGSHDEPHERALGGGVPNGIGTEDRDVEQVRDVQGEGHRTGGRCRVPEQLLQQSPGEQERKRDDDEG